MGKIRHGIAVVGVGLSAALLSFGVPASAATPSTTRVTSAVTPNATEVCVWKFTGAGVRIRSMHNTTAASKVLGEGQKGQTFVSSPAQTATGSGLTWVHGTDTNNGIGPGWAAEEFLALQSCHMLT